MLRRRFIYGVKMNNYIKSDTFKRRVLVVDDEPINRELLGIMLSDSYEVLYAENGQQALDILREARPAVSLLLLDLLMPVMDGFSVIEICKRDESLKKIPIIVMTSEKSAEVRSIRMGAADFITKPYDMPEVILARCERIIEMSEDKSIISFTERDELTDLYSKDYFFAYIYRMLPSVTMDMDAISLNLDRFSLINELSGRREGDRILRIVAELIKKYILESRGIACRSDGDNFYIFCESRNDYTGLLDRFGSELSERAGVRNVSVRAGVYEKVDLSISAESWFDRAKAAGSRMRGQYGGGVAFYDRELYEREMHGERLIGDMQDALENEQFVVYYQPKFRIQGDRPVLGSAEALIRWIHPQLGFISPGEFIPLFERNGLISRLDYYVWRHTAAQIRRWKDEYGVSVPISVNVSRVDIFDPELEEKLIGLLKEHRLTPEDMLLEITESAYSDSADRLVEVINSLRDKGFKIEMDDFGSGYSSLNMLTALPIDVLKMDMKFIRNMLKDEKSLGLVKLVMDIARFLRVPVVAEGVEEERQLSLLKDMGCDIVQGYYFSPPVPAEKFTEIIKKGLKEGRSYAYN